MTTLPPGFGVDLDASLRVHGNILVRDRAPYRVLRLTDAGRRVFRRVADGEVETAASRRLAGRLVDAEMAHLRPPATDSEAFTATVIVPVRDRPAMLARCLAAIGSAAPVIVVDDGSRDGAAVRDVCNRHGATCLRLPRGRGPSAARNAALGEVGTDVVAFVDSDVLVPEGWLQTLLHHFSDPAVGAVAPRVTPTCVAVTQPALAAFLEARCPLDMGLHPGVVGVGRAVAYVPTATLLVRRSVGMLFDEALTVGEDVDLVWRLGHAGWVVRYVPEVAVRHQEPATWRGSLARRFRYGQSVAPLSRRHPGDLPHVVVSPWAAAITALVLLRRQRLAVAVAAARAASVAHRCQAVGVPRSTAAGWGVRAVLGGVLAVGKVVRTFALPLTIAGLAVRRIRRPLLALAAVSVIGDTAGARPRSPLGFAACAIVDDIAYAAGVVQGCAANRTVEPLRPTTSPMPDPRPRPPAPSGLRAARRSGAP